jgi:PIN domain nuclease of toxin-antitoxin system
MARHLLDSNTFIWAKEEPQKLRKEAFLELAKAENQLFVSVASLWELGIKASKGKLPSYAHMLSHGPHALEQALRESRFELLPIRLDHVVTAYNLPRHHNDPFDRLLIAQALAENLSMITSDDAFRRYAGLRVLTA